MYENYAFYKSLAIKGSEWVERYDFKNQKNKSLSLLKPKQIRMGDIDLVTDQYIQTTSPSLYKKYKKMINR